MVGSSTSASLDPVVLAEDEHAEILADFYREVWDSKATAEKVLEGRSRAAAVNPVEPGTPPPTYLFTSAGRAIGHVTTIPIQVWDGERERPAYWIKGLMVLPEHRRGPVGFLLLKEALRQLRDRPRLAMVVAPEARRLFGAMGFADAGVLPNALRLLRPRRFLELLNTSELLADRVPKVAVEALRLAQRPPLSAAAGAILGLSTGLWRGIRGSSALRGYPSPGSPGRLEQTWSAFRSGIGAAPVRGGASTLQRYSHPSAYQFVELEGENDGFAVVRRAQADGGDPRLNGIRVATLSDLVAPLDRPEAVLGLLAAAERFAALSGADALLVSSAHPTLLDLLRRRAYLPVPGNIHFLVLDGGEGKALPRRVDEWWLMRGDSAADETF